MSTIADVLDAAFGASRVGRNVPLAPFTTFKVGGPADWYVETRSSAEVVAAVNIARDARVPLTILGGGSNVLVADAGVRGLVVRPRAGVIHRIDDTSVRADAAVTINGLVRWTILHQAAGLEAWAGTPGTVGGAIFGNAHFGGRLISELVRAVEIVAPDGRVSAVTVDDMRFGYDYSRLQDTRELLLAATFAVTPGDTRTLREAARASLAFRKRTQPLDTPSAGCIFQNPQAGRDVVPDGVPWSAGALIDRAGCKGVRVGGATVSSAHGNFIVNEGAATAGDIRALIERCRASVHERFGVRLREEIVYIGVFD